MNRKRRILDGERFGRLIVIGDDILHPSRLRHVLCLCDCGNRVSVPPKRLRSGRTRSCGCYQKECARNLMKVNIGGGKVTHGMTNTTTYQIWKGMKSRCLNPKNVNYRIYGGRGIAIEERWLTFQNFLNDMGERPEGMTLERKNSNGNYGPLNCIWASYTEQNRNSSHAKLTIHKVRRIREFHSVGVKAKTMIDLFGVSDTTFYDVINCKKWKESRPVDLTPNASCVSRQLVSPGGVR